MALRSICCLSVADATTFSMLMKALPLSDNTGRPSSNRGRRVENSPPHSRKHDYRERSPRWERSSLYRIFKIARSRREKSDPTVESDVRAFLKPERLSNQLKTPFSPER